MPKADRSVVRNQAYQKKAIGIRERHNERKNELYSNPDIVKDRSRLNVHFKQCEGTYAQAFDKLLTDGAISTRGLKQDAKVFVPATASIRWIARCTTSAPLWWRNSSLIR